MNDGFPLPPMGARVCVLFWFTGKARERAEAAYNLLEESLAQGFWVPKASRYVRASLNKSAVTRKFSESAAAKELELARHPYRTGDGVDGWYTVHIMRFGLVDRVPRFDLDKVEKLLTTDAQREALAVARSYWGAMNPIAEAMQLLDSVRPPPVITRIGVSPTITRTLMDIGVDASPDTVTFPPVERRVVKRLDVATGKVTREIHYVILWKPGTLFWISKHCENRTGRFNKCQSCGHAIKKNGHWVPLQLIRRDGTPLGLWVGKDCARNIFGVDVRGDALWAEGEGAPATVQTQTAGGV